MIRLIKDNDLPILRTLSENDPFLVRVLAAYAAYASTNLVQIWVQVEQDNLNAVLCKLDNVITAAGFAPGNMEELAGFLYAVDADRLVCSKAFAKKLELVPESSGPVLHRANKEKLSSKREYERNPSPRELYEVMLKCDSETFRVPVWEPFYLDLSHRTRHQCALSIGIREESGRLCACGFTTAMTEDSAILSGVCVAPELQQKGYGTDVVAALLTELPQEKIYVFREQHENQAFYNSLEFTECATWAEVRI